MGQIRTEDWARIRDTVLASEAQRGMRSPGDDTPRAGPIFPFGSWHPFGISEIAGAVVTVAPGIIYRGGAAIETAETDVTITADDKWICVEYTPGTDSATVKEYGASGIPQDHDGLVVRALYQFDLISSQAVFKRSGLAAIELGMFGY